MSGQLQIVVSIGTLTANNSGGGSTLIQLVPRISGAPNGVADYALVLARALSPYGIKTVFLSGAPSDEVEPKQDEWRTTWLPMQRAQCLADTVKSLVTATNASATLLHLSGYGYHKRGAPFWLLKGLQNWNRSKNRTPLLTIFHELYATGRPWQSSFWLSPFQKLIARGILNLSAQGITSTNMYRDRLLGWKADAQIRVMPVFSNVGEPGYGASPGERDATAIVFGLAGVEDRIFGIYRQEIERIVAILGLEKIFDVGPRFFSMPSTLAGVPLISKGVLTANAVSELLQRSKFGFIAYPMNFICKSSVFAAYAAHGVVPILVSDNIAPCDGLQVEKHLVDGLRLRASIEADHLAAIQYELFNWYLPHSIEAQAQVIQRLVPRHECS